VSEAMLQRMVIDLARWCGFLHMHIHDSRKSSGAGFPDLVLLHVRTGRVIFAELKSAEGRVTNDQQRWLTLLGKRHEVHLWRPADWESGAIRELLMAEREVAA
jgi:hypothetical protein